MMSNSKNVDDELKIKTNRPNAGEIRKHLTGEALFLSPLPLPTGQPPMDIDGSILEINERYIDIGIGNKNKPFQVKLFIAGAMFLVIMSLVIGPTIAGLGAFLNNYGKTFESNYKEFFLSGLPIAAWGGLITIAVGFCVTVSTTLAKSHNRPIRFNRQRREVCIFPNNFDSPIIQKWETLISWISTSTGYTGGGTVINYTFGIALTDPKSGETHFINQGILTPIHGLSKWETIRTFMESGFEHCPRKATYEDCRTFDSKRSEIHEEYEAGERSLVGLSLWYIGSLLTWWKIPYLVSEWDHRYKMRNMPRSIEEWSEPLPFEQWAQPSKILQEQSNKIEKAFASGVDFITYFKKMSEH